MNAKEFNVLLKKYNLGQIYLEKTYEKEGEDTVYAYVKYEDDKPVDLYGSNTYYGIDVNDSTFGQECEGDVTDKTYEEYEICDLQFHTPNWAYPDASLKMGDRDIDDNCGIRIVDTMLCHNVPNMIDAYAEQAIKAYAEPERYQAWLLEMYVQEMKTFNEKHLDTIKKHGFHMIQNDVYKRGFSDFYESELTIEFETQKGTSHLMFTQNMFTGRLTFHVYDEECGKYGEHWYTEYNINEVSTEFLDNFIKKTFDRNGEYFWREHSVNEFFA